MNLLHQAFTNSYYGGMLSVSPDGQLLQLSEPRVIRPELDGAAWPAETDGDKAAVSELADGTMAMHDARASSAAATATGGGGSGGARAIRIAPRLVGELAGVGVVVPPVMDVVAPSIDMGGVATTPLVHADKEAEKRAILEARKRRNRLSAAKSNAKRKERIEGLRRELEDNRKRVELLRAEHKFLSDENYLLKRRVLSMGTGTV